MQKTTHTPKYWPKKVSSYLTFRWNRCKLSCPDILVMIFNRKIDETAAVRKKKISLHFSGGRFHFPRNSSQRCCCYSPSWISSVASSWEGGGNFHQSEHVQGAARHSKLCHMRKRTYWLIEGAAEKYATQSDGKIRKFD